MPIHDLNIIARYKSGSQLAGLIYMHRISDRRFSGIAGRNFKIFRELCGETSLKNVVLVTNMWGEVSSDVGQARETELASNFLKPALDKGARMVRHHNTEQSAHGVLRCIINNHPVVLQIQRELVDEHREITNTSAGAAINTDLAEETRRHEAELRRVEEERARALRQQEEERRRMIQEEERRRQEQLRMVREEQERVALQHRQQMEAEARRLEEQARAERQRIEEEQRHQAALLRERQAAEAAAAAAAEAARAELLHQQNAAQHQINLMNEAAARRRRRRGGTCAIM